MVRGARLREKLLPRVIEARAEHFHEIMNELGELGMLGLTLEEQYGCAGLNPSATAWWRAKSKRSIPATARP